MAAKLEYKITIIQQLCYYLGLGHGQNILGGIVVILAGELSPSKNDTYCTHEWIDCPYENQPLLVLAGTKTHLDRPQVEDTTYKSRDDTASQQLNLSINRQHHCVPHLVLSQNGT